VSGPEWEDRPSRSSPARSGSPSSWPGAGWCCRSDLLTPWDRWLTPEFEPRRYDTYFFLARLPDRQVTRDVGGEAEHTIWGRPVDLTDLPMLPPTLATLRGLSPYPSVDGGDGRGP
jgi:hypothetical protein